LADEVVYEQNLGAIVRSAMGAGADGLIIPNRRGAGMSPVVNRVSMGGAEEVPVVRAGILSAIKRIRKSGFRTVGADMGGVAFWEADLTGPVALILGGESKGLSEPIQKRCDTIVSVPLAHNLDSLNVSVTAGILLFERTRQLQ
jgi:23S rRNA (guanosine2251-2'-O)-methyltransferase